MAKDSRINIAGRDAHVEDAVATEQTPLLLVTSAVPDDLRKTYGRTVVFLCFVIIFIIEVAISLFVPASTAIAELNICHAEHPDLRDGGDYSVCKGPDVQGRLAMLQGWQLTAECIPGQSSHPRAIQAMGNPIITDTTLVGNKASSVQFPMGFWLTNGAAGQCLFSRWPATPCTFSSCSSSVSRFERGDNTLLVQGPQTSSD